MSITGDEGGEPRKVGVAVVDVLTAQFAAHAILAALYERERSGRGQHVEVNLLSSLLSALINQASTYVTTGSVPRAMGNRHPSIAPYETLQTADRLVVVAVGNDAQFAAFARAIGLGWMAEDERFTRNAGRVEHRDIMMKLLQEELFRHPAAECLALIQAAGVPCGSVNDIAEAFDVAERLGLDPVVRLPRFGKASSGAAGEPSADSQVRNPMGFSRTPASYRNAPPLLGEHTREVEAELGLA
jgi:crotonobetainyl-CoA:carnitine CoA-transferase CaiB-like acyl-CoA transferase